MGRLGSLATFLTLALLLSALSAEAGKKKQQKSAAPDTVAGTIIAISEDGKTITVAGFGGKKKKPAPNTVVKLTSKTRIEYIGVAVKAEQKLAFGYIVLVALDKANAHTAAVIAATKAADQVKKKKKTAAAPSPQRATCEQLQQMLAARNVAWQRLEGPLDKGVWKFTCAVPSLAKPLMRRSFEARAVGPDDLAAIRAVLAAQRGHQ